MRRGGAAAVVAALFTALALLVAPAVAAAATLGPDTTPVGRPSKNPVALATTGLDITVPVIVGLSSLVVGICFVCWAFLRKGSTRQH